MEQNYSHWVWYAHKFSISREHKLSMTCCALCLSKPFCCEAGTASCVHAQLIKQIHYETIVDHGRKLTNKSLVICLPSGTTYK